MTPTTFIEKLGEGLGRVLVLAFSIGFFIVGIASFAQVKPSYEQYFHNQHKMETEGVVTNKRVWIDYHYGNYTAGETENVDFKLEGSDLVFNYKDARQKYEAIKNGVKEGMKVKFIHDKLGLIDGVQTPEGWILTWEEAKSEQKWAPLVFFIVGLFMIAMAIGANWSYIDWVRKKMKKRLH